MMHFLLVYDHHQGELVSMTTFSDSQKDKAITAYSDAEKTHARDGNLEIVLIGADSVAVMHKTHGHYFNKGATERSHYLRAVS